MKRLVLGIVFASLFVCRSTAGELEKLKLGTALTGDKPDMEALKGKAVFVELWGVH